MMHSQIFLTVHSSTSQCDYNCIVFDLFCLQIHLWIWLTISLFIFELTECRDEPSLLAILGTPSFKWNCDVYTFGLLSAPLISVFDMSQRNVSQYRMAAYHSPCIRCKNKDVIFRYRHWLQSFDYSILTYPTNDVWYVSIEETCISYGKTCWKVMGLLRSLPNYCMGHLQLYRTRMRCNLFVLLMHTLLRKNDGNRMSATILRHRIVCRFCSAHLRKNRRCASWHFYPFKDFRAFLYISIYAFHWENFEKIMKSFIKYTIKN